jgi:ribosome production factor 2
MDDSLFKKPKSHKGKKHLESKAGKVLEDPKRPIFIKGGKSTETVNQCLKDLVKLLLIPLHSLILILYLRVNF